VYLQKLDGYGDRYGTLPRSTHCHPSLLTKLLFGPSRDSMIETRIQRRVEAVFLIQHIYVL
jgi:hypothetical protein